MEEQIVFSTIHVVGSNNNLEPWSGIDPADSFANPRPDRLAEFEARTKQKQPFQFDSNLRNKGNEREGRVG